MKFIYFKIIILLMLSHLSKAQMTVGGDTLYGNEWIPASSRVASFEVRTDGLYRITYNDLVNAGFSSTNISGNQIVVFNYGKKIPFYASSEGTFSQEDFILIEAKKNRSYLDQFLFAGGKEDLLNPYYSMFSDVNVYYITIGDDNRTLLPLINNDITQSRVPKPYRLRTDTLIDSYLYVKEYSKLSNLSIYESHYIKGEGFSGSFTFNNRKKIHPKDYINGHTDGELSFRILSDYRSSNEVQQYKISFNKNSLLEQVILGSFEMKDYTFQIPETSLGGSPIELQVISDGASTSQVSIPYVFYTYASKVTVDNGTHFSDKLTEEKYYEITGFKSNIPAWCFTTNGVYRTIVSGGVHKLQVQNSSNGELRIYDEIAIKDVALEAGVSFLEDSQFVNKNLIFITSENLLKTVPSIKEYLAYRQSDEGGKYRAEIITIEDIYSTFGYGINAHPQSIKNFIAYAHSHDNLELVYFIGKGLESHYIRTEVDSRKIRETEFEIPAIGYPSSDNLFASPNHSFDVSVAIGRLPFNKESEVALFLSKVKEQETRGYSGIVDNELWRKRIAHINGGGSGEWDNIDLYMIQLSQIIESSGKKLDIYSYIKKTQPAILHDDLEEIFFNINQGVGLVNFFGHSGASSLGIDIDIPEEYRNEHLPILLGMGCSAGNLNIPGESLGERFCGYQRGGYLGFFASTHYATISDLGRVLQSVYQVQYEDDEQLEFGKVIQKALNAVYKSNSFYRRGVEQLMYLGDPCYKIYVPKVPEPALSKTHASLSSDALTNDHDEIELTFDIYNLGTQSEDSLLVNISVINELGKTTFVKEYKLKFNTYKVTQVITIPLDSTNKGKNNVHIEINGDGNIKEGPLPVALSNNSLKALGLRNGLEFFVSSDRLGIISPFEFEILPQTDVNLMVSGNIVVDTGQIVLYEIDTTETFDSPLLQKGEMPIYGGSSSWSPKNLQDSVVYYWRAQILGAREDQWIHSSFICLQDKSGWNQSHYYQFQKDTLKQVDVNHNLLPQLQDDYITIKVRNGLQSGQGLIYSVNGHTINQGSFWQNGFSGAYVIVHSKKEFFHIHNIWSFFSEYDGQYGSHNPSNRKYRAIAYDLKDTTSRINMINFLRDTVQQGQQVAILFHKDRVQDSFYVEEWAHDSTLNNGWNLFNFLESRGASHIRDLQKKEVPYGIFYTQGGQLLDESIGEEESSTIIIVAELPFISFSGEIASPILPYVDNLNVLSYKMDSLETSDTTVVELIESNGKIAIADTSTAINDLGISSIHADTTEFYLHWNLKDQMLRTIPQLHYWRVFYRPIPDYVIEATNSLSGIESVDNFDTMRLDFRIHNVSGDTLKELDYRILIQNSRNQKEYNETFTIQEPIPPYQYIDISKIVNITTKNEKLAIDIMINSDSSQVERTFLNNRLKRNISVNLDNENPYLTVLFDGVQINTRDIVSSTPLIKIILEDANEIPLLDMENLIEFEILDPSGMYMEKYKYGDPSVTFIPGQSQGKQAIVKINGDFENGLYTLIASGRDNSGNPSGSTDYIVQFEVINEMQISYFDAYPNPFSTYTRFKYSLTGDVPPDTYTMNIYNYIGQLVAQLTQEDLGTLRVGDNETDGVWEGRSQTGAMLPSGVYYYKLVLDENRDNYTHLQLDIDKNFYKDYGKVVIIRN